MKLLNINGNRALALAGICIIFLTLLASTLVLVYNDALFLSSYPPHYIIYFYYASTPAIILGVFIIEPYISKGTYTQNILINIILAASLLIGYIVEHYHIYWLPFVFCTYLNVFRVVLMVIASNAVAAAFNIVEFKRFSVWFTSANSMGQILGGYLSAILTKYFGIAYLLFAAIVFIIINAAFLWYLQPKPMPISRAKSTSSPLQYTLLRNILAISLVIGFVYTVATFVLKYQLSSSYTQQEIGIFMGMLTMSVSLIALIIQLLGVRKILYRMGLSGLMKLPPLFAIVGSMFFVLRPDVITATIFYGGASLFESSLNKVAFEVALNPLPRLIRNIGKLYEKGISRQIGNILAISLMLLTTYLGGFRLAGLISLIACFIWYRYSMIIDKNYQFSLIQSINSKRFAEDVTEELAPNEELAAPLMRTALVDNDPKYVRLAFSLFNDPSDSQLQQLALANLNASRTDIRLHAVGILRQLIDPTITTCLAQRLQVETESEIIWELIQALLPVKQDFLQTFARNKIKSTNNQDQLFAALIILQLQMPDYLNTARMIIYQAMTTPEPKIRTLCAKVFSVIKIDPNHKELATLLTDKTHTVVLQAIKSVEIIKAKNLLPQLIALTNLPWVSHSATNTIISFGDEVLPIVIDTINNRNSVTIEHLVRIICAIESAQAEASLLKLAHSNKLLIKTYVAKHILLSTTKVNRSKEFYQAAYELIAESANEIMLFRQALMFPWAGFIRKELLVRLHWSQMRCLYWYGIYTNPKAVFQVIPIITRYSNKPDMELVYASAFELLDSLAKNKYLRDNIASINLTHQILTKARLTDDEIYSQFDDWLKQFIQATTQRAGMTMTDTTKKLLVLRKTELFAQLPGEILLAISEETGWREIAAGEVIFSQGDRPDGFYIIASGEVLIQKDEKIVSLLQDGDYFGEIGIFDNLPRTASAIARTDGLLLVIDNITFDNITTDCPDVMRALARNVITYIRNEVSPPL